MSVVRHPTVLKTSTFSIKDQENTFYMSATLPNNITKLDFFLETSNTLWGHCIKNKSVAVKNYNGFDYCAQCSISHRLCLAGEPSDNRHDRTAPR